MKTLYVSDLDETLLRSDETLSPFTAEAINGLIARGMLFSYATARSYHTASQITSALSPKLPLIVYNGTFILEGGTERQLLSNQFTTDETKRILDRILDAGVLPLVHVFLNGVEKYSYCEDRRSPAMQKFLNRRIGDPRDNPVSDPQKLYRGDVFCVTCMDTAEKLLPLYEALRDEFPCNYFRDLYTGEQWLELNPRRASKANAILALKDLLGCERIVCFGNGNNDVSMFKIADECYAVANAVPALKSIATAVIDSNDEDGVAKWLLKNAKL